MTDAIDKSKEAIAKVLVENNVLSQAQVDLAYMDMDIQDLPFEEVLYMRGWLTQEKLYELAPFLKPEYKSPPKQTEKKEPTQKKSKAKPSQDEAPMLIALGAPQEDPAKETPVIALAAPAREEAAEETPIIALAPPTREEPAEETPIIALASPAEKEEEKKLETSVIALGAPQEDKADEAPPRAFAKEESSADSLFSMESPKQSSIAENSDSLFGGSSSDSADWLFASEKPATKAMEDVPTASSITEEAVAEKNIEESTVSAKVPPAESKETADSELKTSEPKGIASVSSARTEASAEDKGSDTAGGGAAKSKLTDIPGEPPIRSAERPAVIQSPVEKSKEQSLKAYKEILRKILTVEKK
jgi:hypothetical protein